MFAVEYREDSSTMTFTGTHYTLRWVAPEVLEEGNITSTAADIWSMGWVFYEVMTGSIPFETLKKDAAVVMHIANGRLPSLREHAHMSPILRLVSLMMKCWDLDPEKRPSATACRQDIGYMPMCVPCSREVSSSLSLEAALRRYQEGEMYRRQSDYDKALAAYNDALELLSADAIPIYGSIHILWSIAEVHRHRNDYDEAVAKYSEVVRISDEMGDRGLKADALKGLASVDRLREDYDEAVAKYSEVVLISEEIGDRGRKASALFGLAEVHRLQDKYDEAVSKYSDVIRISEDIGDRGRTADALRGLADLHCQQKDYASSSRLYNESLNLARDLGSKAGIGYGLQGLADVYRGQHLATEAIQLYDEVYELFQDIGLEEDASDALQWANYLRERLSAEN